MRVHWLHSPTSGPAYGAVAMTAAAPVLVGMASIPEREEAMLRAVGSLAPQCDRLEVALNGYAAVPAQLAAWPHVVPTLLPDPNLGDGEKFRAVDAWEGVVVTADDDLLYPPDYVASLVAGLARHPGHAVGYHGGTTLGWNGSAVAASHKRIRCLGALEADDTDVNVLGTGVMAYDASQVPVWYGAFRHANMADVQFACHARQLGIRMAALEHTAGWLEDICPMNGGRRIYEAQRGRGDYPELNTTKQREREIRRFDWRQPAPPRPRVHVAVGTCGRPQLCHALLLDLAREAQWVDMSVRVYEDPFDLHVQYPLAKQVCKQHGWQWHRFPHRLGRTGYWRLVDQQLRDARDTTADYFVFLPDDVRLVRHAIPRAIALWHRLQDPATLTLWRLQTLEGQSNWTGRRPRDIDADVAEIYHVDGCYLCQRPTLEDYRYRVANPEFPYPSGSGVGRQLSKRLHKFGRRMYRVQSSLATAAGDGTSMMNPEERVLHPTVTL